MFATALCNSYNGLGITFNKNAPHKEGKPGVVVAIGGIRAQGGIINNEELTYLVK